MQFRSRRDIWFYTIVISALAVVMCVALLVVFYPPDLLSEVLKRAPFITLIVSAPICLFVGNKMHVIHLLGVELQRLVDRDRLTDVATRDYFFARLEHNPDAYGVSLMIDIDHFKQVNDTYGHMIGDEVIKQVAAVLRSETRPNDIVCRFGGEEFVVFLCQADQSIGLEVAERIRARVQTSKVTSSGSDIRVTVSIGGSLKSVAETLDDSISVADAALYRAKNMGRNRTVFRNSPSESQELAS